MEEVCFRYYKCNMGSNLYWVTEEAVSCINNAFKNFVTSRLHSGMCKKIKLRVL